MADPPSFPPNSHAYESGLRAQPRHEIHSYRDSALTMPPDVASSTDINADSNLKSVGVGPDQGNSEDGVSDRSLSAYGLVMNDQKQVDWAAGNLHHPRNWLTLRKVFDTSIVIFLDFFTSVISTAGAPASSAARFEYGLGETLAIFVFVSIYLIGQGIGSVVFPPYSEAFGRKKLYIASTALYAAFSVLTAAVPSVAAVVVGRFVTGLLSGIPTSVVAGSIEDIYTTDERIWLVYAWVTAANTGIIVGPILGSYITHSLGWRWLFYIAAIVAGVATVLLFFILESRPTQLLAKKVNKARNELGDKSLQVANADHMPNFRTFLKVGLFRPLRLLMTEPIVALVSLMNATAFAWIYLFTEALRVVYHDLGLDERQATLPFLAAAIGVLATALVRLHDRRKYATLRREGRIPTPEDKLFGFSLGALALAVGLWWFAWTVPPYVHTHWSASAVALIFVGFAVNELDTVLGGYLVDSYTIYASSAFASTAFLRTILCASFPVFARSMFIGLGSNVATSILAALATVFCVTPFLFARYGKAIRQRSKFASLSLELGDGNHPPNYTSSDC